MNQIHTLYNAALNTTSKTYLCFGFDGYFEAMLATIMPERTFVIVRPTVFDINERTDLDNLISAEKTPEHFAFSAVLCPDKHTIYKSLNQSKTIARPLITVEHIAKPASVRKEDALLVNKQNKANIDIATSQLIQESWFRDAKIIRYHIDIEKPIERKRQVTLSCYKKSEKDATNLNSVAYNIKCPVATRFIDATSIDYGLIDVPLHNVYTTVLRNMAYGIISVIKPNIIDDWQHTENIYHSVDDLASTINTILENNELQSKLIKAGFEYLARYHNTKAEWVELLNAVDRIVL